MDEVYVLKLLQVTKRRLHRLVEEAADLAPDVPVRELLQQADLEEAVLKLIRDKGIDLVVMGAQGHTAAEHFFVGSNTEKLVRMAPCPVLSVKNPVGRFVVRNLVFPSDFSAEADRAVPELRRMQVLFPLATLHLLKVVSGPDKRAAALEKITEFAHRHHLGRYEPAVQEASSPSKGIPAFVGQSATDLVLLPTHGRTGLSRFLQSSIAEYVATHAFPPVLTFKLA
jgi:nucleotide-binding universal stress UspA family protein